MAFWIQGLKVVQNRVMSYSCPRRRSQETLPGSGNSARNFLMLSYNFTHDSRPFFALAGMGPLSCAASALWQNPDRATLFALLCLLFNGRSHFEDTWLTSDFFVWGGSGFATAWQFVQVLCQAPSAAVHVSLVAMFISIT